MNSPPTLYVPPAWQAQVSALGWHQHLHIAPLATFAELPSSSQHPQLWFDGQQLQLVAPDRKMSAWVSTDEVARRARGASLLARACQVGGRAPVSVLDAMAGWGVDGLALQRRGARIVQIERSPIAWALLSDLRRRLGLDVTDAQRPGLHCADAWDELHTAGAAADIDVVYLDPMFEPRKKSALPGKRLQLLAGVVQEDDRDLQAWIRLAQQVARQRVVLKRRLKDPVLSLAPAWQLRGRAVRYDCYVGHAR